MRLSKLRSHGKASMILLAGMLMPIIATSGEFRLDIPPGKLSATQLIEFNRVKGVADQQGNRTHPSWWGITEWATLLNGLTQDEINELIKNGKTPISFHAEQLKTCKTNKVCLKMTDLKLEYQPRISMGRLEWKHEWPEKSLCYKEWVRTVGEIENHERQHAKDVEDIVKELNANILKRQEYRTISGDTEIAARAKMEQLLGQAIEEELNAALKKSEAKEKETHRNYPIHDPDYKKCMSYSFEGLKIQWHTDAVVRSPTSGKVYLDEHSDSQISASGKICGNPPETDLGFIDMAATSSKGDNRSFRFFWSLVRNEVLNTSNPNEWYTPKFLSDPPQFEMTGPSSNSVMTITPSPPKARVPAIVSEEPLGCE